MLDGSEACMAIRPDRCGPPRAGFDAEDEWYGTCKIAVDFALSLFLLVLAGPLIVTIVLLVKLTSRGPVIYSQTRSGRNGRPFTIYKIRTMFHKCESLTGPQWATERDPRITPLGRFLRRSHLDELPQLWNVLRGDMSLVGPRPERPEFVSQLERAIPYYRDRMSIRPGVTGLAQVQLPPDTDLASVRRKLACDLYYIQRISPWLDLKILLSTASNLMGIPGRVSRILLQIPSGETVERPYRLLVELASRAATPEMPRAEGPYPPMISMIFDKTADRIMLNAADPARPDLLYLAHRVPYPPDKGDRIRTFHLLRMLSQRSSVHLACLADERPEDSTVAALRHYCEQVAIVSPGTSIRWIRALRSLALGRTVTEGAFSSPDLRAILGRWARETRFHAALASASSMVPYFQMDGLRDIPSVIDLIDVDSQKWLDYAVASRGPRAWLYRTEGRRLRRLEHHLADWASAVTVVSEAEACLYRQFRADGAIHAVPNGVDLDYFQPSSQGDERGCVFVGALDYRPNMDGICWFCRNAWPEIHRRHLQAKTTLVGRRPTPAVRRLSRMAGVELIGQVPDVRPYLAEAAVVVVPLQIARGVQNKVLEALAMGKAVVSSPQALVGLRVEPGVHVLEATTPGEWVDGVSRLLNDQDLRRQLGSAGRRYVEEFHHWDRCLAPFEAILGLPTRTGASAAVHPALLA